MKEKATNDLEKKHETFLYLWYDGRSKKFYMGKHLGIPEDSYTHSSSIWESFTKDNIPERVHRRILTYGTDEEMCILENKCLDNRKSKGEYCWKRYYNRGLGNPCYIDQSGENNTMHNKKHTEKAKKKMSIARIGDKHPNWKGGITYDMKAYKKKYNKEYHQRPEAIARKKELSQTPEYKARRKAYLKEYDRKRDQTPERKAQRKARYHRKVEIQYFINQGLVL